MSESRPDDSDVSEPDVDGDEPTEGSGMVERPTHPSTTRQRRMLGVALACWASCIAAAALFASSGGAPSSTALAICAAFVPYAWLLSRHEAVPLRVLLICAATGGLALVVSPSVLSDDLYRFLWDARVSAAGIDPYLYAPSDPALAHLRDALYPRINHPDIPTIYPPIAQWLFSIANRISHAPWTMKALALSAHLGAVPLVAEVARTSRRVDPRHAALAFALNPLALSESALGGHIDVFVGIALALALWALLRSQPFRAAWALGLASGLKLVGLLLVPVLALKDRRAAVLAIVIGACAVVPLVSQPRVGGLGQYAGRWQGNAAGYALIEHAASQALEAGWGVRPGQVRLDAWHAWFARMQGSALDPRRTFAREKKPVADLTLFDTHVLASFLARGIVLFGLVFFALRLVLRQAEPLRAARLLLFATLLFAPQVHPWYLLWLLPLECAAGGIAGLVWSAAILSAYAPLDVWLFRREWIEVSWGVWVQSGLVAILLALEALEQNSDGGVSERVRPDEGFAT